MHKDDQKNAPILSTLFAKVSQPWDSLKYAIINYPSKATAATAVVADVMFGAQSFIDGNYLGVYAAAVGLYGDAHLFIYGDPKISAEQAERYVDPQDRRNMVNWVNEPTKYPWEYVGLIRMVAMSSMLMGGVGLGGNHTMNWGDIAYSSFALGGYFVKMGIAEKPQGSVEIPENSNRFLRPFFRLKAYVQENPNPTAGLLWNAGLVPYAADAILKGDWLKMGSAAFYFMPNTFTMLSSKRAQVLPEKSPAP